MFSRTALRYRFIGLLEIVNGIAVGLIVGVILAGLAKVGRLLKRTKGPDKKPTMPESPPVQDNSEEVDEVDEDLFFVTSIPDLLTLGASSRILAKVMMDKFDREVEVTNSFN